MMTLLSEKLTARPSRRSRRLFLVALMAGPALAMALSIVFAADAQAKKKKRRKLPPGPP